MYILGGLLLIVGAVIGYAAKSIIIKITKKQPDEFDILKFKVIGLIIAILGAALIVIYL